MDLVEMIERWQPSTTLPGHAFYRRALHRALYMAYMVSIHFISPLLVCQQEKLKQKELGQEVEIKYKLAKSITDMYSNVKEPDEIQSYRPATDTAQSEPGKLQSHHSPVTSQLEPGNVQSYHSTDTAQLEPGKRQVYDTKVNIGVLQWQCSASHHGKQSEAKERNDFS